MISNSKRLFLFLLCMLGTFPLFSSGAKQRAILRKQRLGALKKTQQRKEKAVPSVKNTIVQTPLAQIDWCAKLEREALSRLRHVYKLSDAHWQPISQMLELVKQLTRDKFRVQRIQYKHDERIPKVTLDLVRRLLTAQGIEPTSIDILLMEQRNGKKGCKHEKFVTYAEVSQRVWTLENSRTGQITIDSLDHPQLYINPALFTLSPAEIEAAIIHEIGHLLEAHSAKAVVLDLMVKKRGETQQQHSARSTIDRVFELIADQKIASSSKMLAEKILRVRAMSAQGRYSNERSEDNYPSLRERYDSFREMYNYCFNQPNLRYG